MMVNEQARCHLRELTEDDSSERQQTIDDNFILESSTAARKTGLTYLVSEFRLNSVER
ncbi:MAG: hypothetical protein BAJATHORv1_160011, partial [Candidatus Thorarchaeota archaeon]